MKELTACHECDLLLNSSFVTMQKSGASCPRCAAELFRVDSNSLERSLALTCAALILLFLANAFPIVGVLVSLVKLSHLADVLPGPAIWCFGGLMLVLAALSTVLDHRTLWQSWEMAR